MRMVTEAIEHKIRLSIWTVDGNQWLVPVDKFSAWRIAMDYGEGERVVIRGGEEFRFFGVEMLPEFLDDYQEIILEK